MFISSTNSSFQLLFFLLVFVVTTKSAPLIFDQSNQIPSNEFVSSCVKKFIIRNTIIYLIKLAFMRQFGYIGNVVGDSESQVRDDYLIEAIRQVQRFGALNETGIIDPDTLNVLVQYLILIKR